MENYNLRNIVCYCYFQNRQNLMNFLAKKKNKKTGKL